MNTLFEDELIDSKFLRQIRREITKVQLEGTIEELNYINEIQSKVLTRYDFTPSQNEELEYIKKLNNAATRQKLQA